MASSQDFKEIGLNLYLVGFMGVGKSTCAQNLSQMLNLPFISTDKAIEEKMRYPITKIFESQGESRFRSEERLTIEKIDKNKELIIDCGGGLFCEPGMPELIKSKGICIYLKASAEDLFHRLDQSCNAKRFLLKKGFSPTSIKQLLDKRETYYNQAHHTIDTSNLSLDEVSQAVASIYQNKVV